MPEARRSPRFLARSLHTFLDQPASVRNAMRVIVVATLVTTLLGGLLVWILDRRDFSSFGLALWWALQTVTTVGYGDVTPKNPIGRLIGAIVLVYAVAFLAILTAAITTSFVEQARRERRPDETTLGDVVARLDDIAARLDRIEQRSDAAQRAEGRG